MNGRDNAQCSPHKIQLGMMLSINSQVQFYHFSPDSPSEKSFGEIVNVLKSNFKLNPQLIVKRFCFSGRQQAADETVAEFAAELRRLSEHREFKTYLDDALRGSFVAGLYKERSS